MWQKLVKNPKIKIQAARGKKNQIKGFKPQNEKIQIQKKKETEKI